jgi:hypothetical protein
MSSRCCEFGAPVAAAARRSNGQQIRPTSVLLPRRADVRFTAAALLLVFLSPAPQD